MMGGLHIEYKIRRGRDLVWMPSFRILFDSEGSAGL